MGDIRDTNRLDRIHDNLTLVHTVTTAHLDMGTRPDANAAPDPPASNSVSSTLRCGSREYSMLSIRLS
jgi:hypothetical protein